ncbi:MAG: helix-turn-helix domain-containing protein [Thermonemataceae bacterium]
MFQEGITLVLSCLGLAQALFLSLYLFTLKKGNILANRLLAWMLLGFTIRIGKSVLHNYLEILPWQKNIGIAGILIVGPSLWLYGRVLLEKEKQFQPKDYWHYLPCLAFMSLSALIPNTQNIASYLSYGIVVFHLAIYLVLSVYTFYKNRLIAKPELIKWFGQILIGVGLIWFFYVGIFADFIPFYIGGAIFYSFLIYAFSFLFLKRHIFALEKYARSSMDQSQSRVILQQLKRLLEEEKLYLESHLSLQAMAQRLALSPRQLSQVINEQEKKNFSEFVNHYRIEKAKELLVHPDYVKEKIATIAYDSGFGNVTSFNIAFKAATNLTPSQYKNLSKTTS